MVCSLIVLISLVKHMIKLSYSYLHPGAETLYSNIMLVTHQKASLILNLHYKSRLLGDIDIVLPDRKPEGVGGNPIVHQGRHL